MLFRSAKEAANGISCTNNLKQIGLAQAGYSSDFDDWIVPGCIYADMDSSARSYYSYYSCIWFGLLSGYSPNGRPLTSGYGTELVNLTGKTAGTFACPSEPAKFGSVPDTFGYTHYGINIFLSGVSNKQGDVTEVHRRVTSVRSASQAWLIADSLTMETYMLCQVHWPAFRHGNPDPRPRDRTHISPVSNNGKCNFLFMDGHVSGATYPEFRTWGKDLVIPAVTFQSTYNNRRQFVCGFDLK